MLVYILTHINHQGDTSRKRMQRQSGTHMHIDAKSIKTNSINAGTFLFSSLYRTQPGSNINSWIRSVCFWFDDDPLRLSWWVKRQKSSTISFSNPPLFFFVIWDKKHLASNELQKKVVVVSKVFVSPCFGNWSNLTDIFFKWVEITNENDVSQNLLTKIRRLTIQ